MFNSMSSKKIFMLTKYSRATYRQSDIAQNTQSLKGDCDWQHHTQPILRLLLELSKSAQGVPESVRLRVVWTVDKSRILTNSQPFQQENNIFEDVDLLVVRRHIHPFPTQGLPLKAVFRDNMVGIRYLPPQAKSNSPSEYLRFQMTFQCSGDATILIEAIRDVCPCKPSPLNNSTASISSSNPTLPRESDGEYGIQQPQAPFPTPFRSQPRRFQLPPGSGISSITGQHAPGCFSMPPSSQTDLYSEVPADFSVPSSQSRQNSSVPNLDLRLPVYQSNAALSSHQSMALIQQSTQMDLSSSSRPAPYSQSQRSEIQVHAPGFSMPICGSNVRDTQTTSSDSVVSRDVVMPTPPTSSQGPEQSSARRTACTQAHGNSSAVDRGSSASTKHPLLESLYEACRLDNIPRDELEQLVAHIVREEGFIQLLEKVELLWQMNAAINA